MIKYYFDAGIHLNRIIAAPIVIALSATLKTGQTRKSIKSTTYPKVDAVDQISDGPSQNQ